MSKKTNRIKKGDWVRIDNPEIFIRCGYPLSIEDMRREIKEKNLKDIEEFINKIAFDRDTPLTDSHSSLSIVAMRSMKGSVSKSVQKIIDALAYEKLRFRGFGGPARSIHTQYIDSLAGKVFKVHGSYSCVSGEYIPAYSTYDGYSEPEPAYLDGQKHHRILTLGNELCDKGIIWTYDDFDDMNRIEDIHVTKVDIKELAEKKNT